VAIASFRQINLSCRGVLAIDLAIGILDYHFTSPNRSTEQVRPCDISTSFFVMFLP
jgi:hypothetical protein